MGHCGPGEVGVDGDDGQWSYYLMVTVISYAEMQKVADMADISVLFFHSGANLSCKTSLSYNAIYLLKVFPTLIKVFSSIPKC